MRVLLIGSTGMVGSALLRRRPAAGEWLCADHGEFELGDPRQVAAALERHAPDIVINAAAFLGADPCALDPERACAVNALGPWHLARACSRLGIALAHFSTDAVFDGLKGAPYTEEDCPRPVSLYGLTKNLGDLAVRANCPRHWVLRIPLLFGTRENRGAAFVDRMVCLARAGKRDFRVADDVVSSPSYSDDIAGEVIQVVLGGAPHGLYHLRNAGEGSLFDLTTAVFGRLGIDARVERARAADFAAGEQDRKPLRTPLGSVRREPLRPWEEALDDYVAVLRSRGES